MTRYAGNEPIEPFVVIAKTIQCTVENGEKGSSGGGGKVPSAKHSTMNLEDLDTTGGKIAVAVLLGAAFLMAKTHPMLCQITVLILPLVVMYRLDSRRRRIAAAPVIFAAMMLASKIGGGEMGYVSSAYGATASANVNELRIWLPLLLAGCLFYMPKFPTYTERILLVLSLVLLLSGLLPGDGFGVIFVTAQYFLFLAFAIGLGIDLTQNGRMFTSEASSTGR